MAIFFIVELIASILAILLFIWGVYKALRWRTHARSVQNIYDITFWPTEVTRNVIKYAIPLPPGTEMSIMSDDGKSVGKPLKLTKATLSFYSPAVTMRFVIVNPNQFPETVKDMALTITRRDDGTSYKLGPIYFGREDAQAESEIPSPLLFEKFIEKITVAPLSLDDAHQVTFIDILSFSPPQSDIKIFKNNDDLAIGRYECLLTFKYNYMSRRIAFKFNLDANDIESWTHGNPMRLNRYRLK